MGVEGSGPSFTRGHKPTYLVVGQQHDVVTLPHVVHDLLHVVLSQHAVRVSVMKRRERRRVVDGWMDGWPFPHDTTTRQAGRAQRTIVGTRGTYALVSRTMRMSNHVSPNLVKSTPGPRMFCRVWIDRRMDALVRQWPRRSKGPYDRSG